ncbi:MAG: type I restriction endonuclease [Fusobacteriaceae bacterium]
MQSIVCEDDLEKEYISTLENLGYEYKYGKFLLDGLRETMSDVIFVSVLREAINKIAKNNLIPDEFKEEVIKKVLYLGEPILLKANETFHKMLVEGVPISPYTDLNGNKFAGGNVLLIDFENPENNNFMVVNQFTVVERDNRRPDIILFVNGLPLVLIELKSLADERVGLKEAFNQVSHYQNLIPSIFRYNAFIVLGDGVNSKVGTLTSPLERFMNFKSIDGINIARNSKLMESLCHGVFAKDRILEIIREYILFYDDDKENGKIKIMAQYQQYYAVKKALEKTREAKNNHGKIGVVWHTQGSGKSFTMVFYTGQLMKKFNNPTILVVTDRNDLDDQLFKTFSCASSYLVENPKQVKEKDNLKEFLDVAS